MTNEQALTDRAATPLELFFDLVFVFGITQITEYLIEHLDPAGFGRGALLAAMLWWAWTQFTWTANALDIEENWARLGIVAAMGAAFVLARGVTGAFADGGLWVAGGYLAVRYLGMGMQLYGTREDATARTAVMTFVRFGWIPPLVILAGAFVDDPARSWIWLAGWLLELLNVAWYAGEGEWYVLPGHFAERHGLIIIIALGESIVAVGAATGSLDLDSGTALVMVLALAATAAMWWTYFDRFKDYLEHRLAATADLNLRGRLARDAYSVIHFPMIAGIIVFAVAAKFGVAHPEDPLEGGARLALALGLGLFLLAQVASAYRAGRVVLAERAAAAVAIAVVAAAAGGLDAPWLLLIATFVILAALGAEARAGRLPVQ